jgi:hypothetical protein
MLSSEVLEEADLVAQVAAFEAPVRPDHQFSAEVEAVEVDPEFFRQKIMADRLNQVAAPQTALGNLRHIKISILNFRLELEKLDRRPIMSQCRAYEAVTHFAHLSDLLLWEECWDIWLEEPLFGLRWGRCTSIRIIIILIGPLMDTL